MSMVRRAAMTRRTATIRPPDRASAGAAGGLLVALVASFVLATAAAAQTQPVNASSVAEAMVAAQRAHLWRVAGWGTANLLAGLGLVVAMDGGSQPGWRGFGIQAAAWGAINLAIVGWAFGSGIDAPAGDLAGALAAEDAYGNILLVNLGLNVGYILVGGTLALASGQGLAHGRAVRGHGLGVVVQGLGLLVLDGIAYAGSRSRMATLQSLVDRIGSGEAAGSLDITLLSFGL